MPGPTIAPPVATPPERLILRALVHGHIRPSHPAARAHIHEHHACCRESDCFERCFPPAPYWKFLEYNNLEFRWRIPGPIDPPAQPVAIAGQQGHRPDRAPSCTPVSPAAPRATPAPANSRPEPGPVSTQRRAIGARFRLPPAPVTGRLIDLFI